MSAMTADGLADLLACVAAFGRSLDESFDPARFLAEFSARTQRLVPHDEGRASKGTSTTASRGESAMFGYESRALTRMGR